MKIMGTELFREAGEPQAMQTVMPFSEWTGMGSIASTMKVAREPSDISRIFQR